MTEISKLEQIDQMARAGDTVGDICKALGVTTEDIDDAAPGYGGSQLISPVRHEFPCENCYQTWRHMRRFGAVPYCHHRSVTWIEAADGVAITKPMSRREYHKQLQARRFA